MPMASQWRIGSRWSSVPAQASRNYQKIQDFWEGLCEARYLASTEKVTVEFWGWGRIWKDQEFFVFMFFPILPIPSHSFHFFPLCHPEAAESVLTCCSNPVVESGGASWIRCSLPRCNSAKVVIFSIVFWYEILSWFAFGTHLKFLIQGMVQLECQEKREGLEIEMPIRFLWAALEREGMYTA